MNTGDDDLSSGINGRLRPRKSYVCSPQTTKAARKLDSKSSQEKSKRVTALSKALLTKPDDLSKKSDCSSAVEYLCPYCDKIFLSKQAAAKHARRIHFSTSKQDIFINCLYCNHTEPEPNDIFKHMIDSHPNQYFACLDCHTRFSSTTELAEHKLNICERQKLPYRSKLRQKSSRTNKKPLKIDRQVVIRDEITHGYNSIVISCELKPTHVTDGADIEDNIPTNLILPSNKNLGNKVIDKNAVILLDDLQWNKRIPHNFSFHNTDADQILSRLGVVHRSPRTGESTRKDWFKIIDDTSQKFERCFDTSFYSKVASNVHENLSKFLDGSFNFNPDPNHTIKYRKAKNSVPINTVEGFPILLSCEQYSRNLFDGYMPRALAPKHKWKWENLENDRNPFNADQIKRDSHINNCIVTLVSSLDIWTQLCMRKKFEEKFKTTPLEKKTEKRKIIGNELKEILESRQLPTPTAHITRKCNSSSSKAVREGFDFPSSLGLTPTCAKYEIQPAVLSGEWVRPRCYVCCACGAQTRDPRTLSSHIATQHPNAQVQHYEIPGELLLNADILKHLYVPPSPVHNRTRLARGFRECTKCNKSITLEDLHQHMLDCAGDTPTVRRKCRYRQFGVRKRRTRIQESRVRKKMRKDIHRQNGLPRPKIRTEVGDAETIRKMLADLPAKRHRVVRTPLSSNLRPRRKIVKQRNLLTLKKRLNEESKNRKVNERIADKPEIRDLNKINYALDENKTSVQRIQNKLTRRTNILNTKVVRKTIRNTVEMRQVIENKEYDDQTSVYDYSKSSSCSVNIQPVELSTENKSNRIYINSGPYNTREHANRSSNDGSNNRDNQQPDPNDNNGNSRDNGIPPQNVPLKHSIARLTADSDTQDKAVQFHHLFLVQQECNNVTQHVPSGQVILFENKGVAAKLDKPPLDSYQRDGGYDAQNSQKNKLTKHKKGLNDCIAMLKNKLGEPLSKAPNVSIQCKMDEPNELHVNQAPKTVKNNNRIDITVQCPDESQPSDTLISSRYKQPTNGGKTIEEHIASLPTIGEYIKQNPELLIKHKVNLNSIMNSQAIENKTALTISNKDIISKNQKLQPRDDLPKSNITYKSPKLDYNRQTKNELSERIKQRQQPGDGIDVNKSNNKVLQTVNMPGSQMKAISNNYPLTGAHASVISNIKDAKINLFGVKAQNNKPQVRALQVNEEPNQNATDFVYQEENKAKKKYNSADTIPPAHCNAGVESILTSPLDLSGKLYANEVIAHCSKQDISYSMRACDHYETLDLSSKGTTKQNHDVAILPFHEEVVDLRVKHVISTQSADSSIYSEENSNNMSTATDLSLRNTEIHCAPTDLSIKGNTNTEYLNANITRNEINRYTPLRPTPDLINTQKDTNTMCLNLSANEIPCLDLSRKVSHTVPLTNRSLIETNKCSSSNTDNDKYTLISPSNLSCQNNQEKHAKSNKVTTQAVECNMRANANKALTKTALTSKIMNNNEVLGYESNENQSRKVRYNTSEFLTRPASSDVTISIINKPNSDFTIADLTCLRNSSELSVKENAEKVKYSLDKTLNVECQSSELSKPGLSGNRDNVSPHVPILRHISNPLSIESMTVKPIKLNSTAIASTSTVYTTISGPGTMVSNYGHTLDRASTTAPKHSIEKQDIHYHTAKSRHLQNMQQGNHNENCDKIIHSGVDQDPETAKKIAMLPKELVEILGNMPVNHRNQLLNVLPQYVSSSISPPPNRHDAVNLSTSSTSDDSKNNSVPACREDITHSATQYSNSGIPNSQEPIVEQYQIHHTNNSYQKPQKFTNKTYADDIQATGVEGNVSSLPVEDMKTKRQSNDIIDDPIIDLTDDNVDIKHVVSSPEKEIKNVVIAVKSVGQKSNNEKTASLRAVRIKAPSERQKIIKADTQMNKTYQENNNIIKLNMSDNNKDTPPLAVQQFEITTTEEARVVNLQSSISVICPDPTFINTATQKLSPEGTIHETRRENITPLEIDKANKLSNVTPITMQSQLKSPTVNVHDNDQTKLNCNMDPQKLHETHINSIKSSQGHKIEKDFEEDDSEDDLSLAVIVKQKQKEQTRALPSYGDEDIEKSGINDFNRPLLLETVVNTPSSDLVAQNLTCDMISDKIDDKVLNDVITNRTNNIKEGKKYKHSKKIKQPRESIASVATVDNDFAANKEPRSDVNSITIVNSVKREEENQNISNANKTLEKNEENENTENSKNMQIKHLSENIKEKCLNKAIDISEGDKVSLPDLKNLNDTSVEQNEKNVETVEKVQKYFSKDLPVSSIDSVYVSKDHITADNIGNKTKLHQLSHHSSTQLELLETLHNEEPVSTVYKCNDIKERNNELLNSEKCNFIAPLRRSRRGKSLFVESSDVPYENKNNSDIGIDQRGPLTKKQLIFSKLLQDEENTVIQTKACNTEKHENQPCVLNIDSIISDVNADETEALIKKVNKRKQSPQTRKKPKKKKSIDKSLLTEDLNSATKEAEFDSFDKKMKIKHDEGKFVSKDILKNEENILPTFSEKAESVYTTVDTSIVTENNLKTINKRKSNLNTKGASSSSKPKKFKFCIDNEEKDVHLGEQIKNKVSIESIPQVSNRRYANKPAARRGRSKSVFVKSSTPETYDPYDIDLEDMVTTTKPFLKRESLNRTSIKKKASKYFIENRDEPICTETISATTVVINNNDLQKDQENVTNDVQIEPIVERKPLMCDSDDSSKSDEPLKKYVEEKEKKKLEVKHQEKNIAETCKTSRKKNKKVHSVNSAKLDHVHSRDENEERIRSEQFMESFGFFSERKPRKSNLLATKKISETFHIIANENDDSLESKDKSRKKSLQTENRKSADDEGNLKESFINTSNKKVSKRGRNKKIPTKIEPSFCGVCRKEFRRPDNFLRHQMTLAHASRVSEVELKVKNVPMIEESNYLVIYRQQLDRLRALQNKITRRKKYCKSLEKIPLPTLEEIIADVSRTVRQQQLARRGLSRDEALFLDCCELLNGSHNHEGTGRAKGSSGSKINCYSCAQTSADCLNLLEKRIDERIEGKCDDGDVDSITAQDILESEEVRNLENDLISGLKEAACANSFNSNPISHATYVPEPGSAAKEDFNHVCQSKDTEIEKHSEEAKIKKVFEVKEKMYPDVIEDIDMFEDKFDKIKRKCRSQAAKQTQYVETSISPKSRKKVDKKKKKKSLKKNSSNAVPTKGALKGFEGVKVSILTSEINMSSILPPSSTPVKKKKRRNSKRKKERKHSGDVKYDSDAKNKESHSKVDVYEFMDNEDAELFEFRPSTLMERFKSISNNNKDMPSTSKSQPVSNDPEISNESASDGDDFVYMSDDYICSDAETENSLISSEIGQVKGITEIKKPLTPPKKKDTTEKSAVMGKIFKHNAVRTEKKVLKVKEQTKPKANLDQLFDSLLEEEQSSSMLSKNSLSPKNEDELCESHLSDTNDISCSKHINKPVRNGDQQILHESDTEPSRKPVRSPSPIPYTSLVLQAKKHKSRTIPRKERSSFGEADEHSMRSYSNTTKTHEDNFSLENRQTNMKHSSHRKKEHTTVHAKYDDPTLNRRITFSPLSNYDDDSLLRVDDSLPISEDCSTNKKRKSKEKVLKNRTSSTSSDKKLSNSFEYNDAILDDSYDTGVARQRVRRKCTVGKQNVLAETWSSESEPDGMPRRPNSADSVVASLSRKKRSRKKEGQAPGARKNSNRQVVAKRHEVDGSLRSCRNSSETLSKVVPTSRPSAVGPKIRPRPPPYYWSDEEEEQEHVQQHGWIVGDSHKKLVTMLAHAKGKRNNDDKHHLVE